MSLTDITPKGLLLTGLVFATALTVADAARDIFTQDTLGSKLGKAGVAGLFVVGTSVAAKTILKHHENNPAKMKYYK